MKNRKTITFPNDLIIWIENYRANQRPIPTFTNAVTDLLRIARTCYKKKKRGLK